MIASKIHSLARALRTPGQLFSIALASALIIAAAGPAARAQYAPAATGTTIELEAYVVSASRTEQNIKLTPSSVTSLALSEMHRIQIPDLRSALQFTPGVNVTQAGGGAGSLTAINIRGAGAKQTLFLIDGIRMNAEDETSGYGNYLGSAGLAGLDRVEILRGPQSTLYGSAAMGGVISLETARGRGPVSGGVSVEGGSFNTMGATASAAGSAPISPMLSSRPQVLNYSAALTAYRTDNDRDYNASRQFNASTRIEYQLADCLAAGFTCRGLRARYEEPGSTAYFAPGLLNLNIDIATIYAEWKPIETFKSRLTYGWIQNIYDWKDVVDSYNSTNNHSTRNVIDWQNTWQALKQIQITAGINAEWSIYDYHGYKANYDNWPDITYTLNDPAYSERLASAYINAVANPIENLELTLGVRGDDYSTFNSHAIWRAGAAYRIGKTHTTLRATYGTSFNAPSPQYILGGGWYIASTGLKPEKSKGWDTGVEQDLWCNRITLGATWFQNDFEDKLIANAAPPDYSLYKYTNVPGATTKGIEAYIYARPIGGMNVQIAYTHLNSRDNTGARLPRQNRHNLTTDINYQFTKELLIGAGLTWIGNRSIDNQYNPVKLPDYTILRAYASYALPRGLKLKLRVENLLDKKYETIAGYPGLPLGIFGGVEWKF